jgi:hypothetical protein
MIKKLKARVIHMIKKEIEVLIEKETETDIEMIKKVKARVIHMIKKEIEVLAEKE